MAWDKGVIMEHGNSSYCVVWECSP